MNELKRKKNHIREFNHLWIGLTDHGLDQNSSPISLMWRTARRLVLPLQHTKWREGREGGGFPFRRPADTKKQKTNPLMTGGKCRLFGFKCSLVGLHCAEKRGRIIGSKRKMSASRLFFFLRQQHTELFHKREKVLSLIRVVNTKCSFFLQPGICFETFWVVRDRWATIFGLATSFKKWKNKPITQ